jgi:hypothetical protein
MGWYESQLMDLYMVLAIAPHSGQVSIWLPLPASPNQGRYHQWQVGHPRTISGVDQIGDLPGCLPQPADGREPPSCTLEAMSRGLIQARMGKLDSHPTVRLVDRD